MTYETIISMIGSLGFPIATCLVCFWYINKYTETTNEKLDKLSEAINNNSTVIQRLLDKLSQ